MAPVLLQSAWERKGRLKAGSRCPLGARVLPKRVLWRFVCRKKESTELAVWTWLASVTVGQSMTLWVSFSSHVNSLAG